MSKIVLPPVTGADNLSTLNSNFSKIEEALNDKAEVIAATNATMFLDGVNSPIT